MKKLMSLVVAATFVIAPLAQANAQGYSPEPRRHDGPTRMVQPPKHQAAPQYRVAPKRYAKPRYERGQRLDRVHRNKALSQRDLRRYRLPEARRGERWVRVNDQFLLINAASGLIRGLSQVNGR